ncbi:MAG TPA: ACP S-malonyltransferase, partial [Methylophilaceae bacterium]|nr:ACP S-malonyltransferase [Methylophilaceae bacterium]
MANFAFFFPGQGSQSVGMMKGFESVDVVRQTFSEASDVLSQDFWQMVTEPNDLLNQTIHTQPLMLTAGIAVWRAWQEENGSQPAIMAGHSLGEYTALVAAGALEFKDALPLVRYRAQAMQEAVADGVGAMAAVLGLSDEDVRRVCMEGAQGQVLEAVNLNSPGQVVIAGHKEAVTRGMQIALDKGAKRALPLPVSVPSHCALMKPAADALRTYMHNVAVAVPEVPVIHNADVASYDNPEEIKDALTRQLYSPVRWVETVEHIFAKGVNKGAECGPGKVLTGLVKRINPEFTCLALTSGDTLTEA